MRRHLAGCHIKIQLPHSTIFKNDADRVTYQEIRLWNSIGIEVAVVTQIASASSKSCSKPRPGIRGLAATTCAKSCCCNTSKISYLRTQYQYRHRCRIKENVQICLLNWLSAVLGFATNITASCMINFAVHPGFLPFKLKIEHRACSVVLPTQLSML